MSGRSRLQGFIPESDFRALLEKVESYINHPTLERNLLMAIQADVQKLVDEVAQNKDLVTSVAQALQVQGKQIDDLKATVAGFQAGQVLTIDDLTAIQGAAVQLGETNTALQTAVPANTPGQPSVPPVTSAPPVTTSPVEPTPPAA